MGSSLSPLSLFSDIVAIVKASGGGPTSWITIGVIAVIGLFLYITSSKAKKKDAAEKDDQTEAQQQAEGKIENNQIEASASNAEGNIQEIINKEPDTNKEERPRD